MRDTAVPRAQVTSCCFRQQPLRRKGEHCLTCASSLSLDVSWGYFRIHRITIRCIRNSIVWGVYDSILRRGCAHSFKHSTFHWLYRIYERPLNQFLYQRRHECFTILQLESLNQVVTMVVMHFHGGGYSRTASGSYGLRAPAREIEIDEGDTGHILKLLVPGGGYIYDERDHKLHGFASFSGYRSE